MFNYVEEVDRMHMKNAECTISKEKFSTTVFIYPMFLNYIKT